MPTDETLRENAGLLLSVLGLLYGVLAAVVGWLSRKLSKLRDHDEDIRRLTAMQSETAQILACIREDHTTEVRDRRDEEARIYQRIEAVADRYDKKVDEIKESLHDVALRVERALQSPRETS